MLITEPLFLHFPVDDLPLILTTDASDIGVCGVLQQELLSYCHGRNLQTNTITSHHQVKTISISGLQWKNVYGQSLCLFSLIHQDQFSSLISSTAYLLLLVGTNSLRNLPATEVINQVDDILHFLYSQHHHLINQKIVITSCIPCFKIPRRFGTVASLMNNIHYYNQLLFELSSENNFLYFDLQVPTYWLGDDMIHVAYQHRHDFSNSFLNYTNSLQMHTTLPTRHNIRSREVISRRNEKEI
ncbi:unnamed protein product [Rotaria socialis]|uniref:Reverse transcriptase/retrotransposon-derived protein RNase H-like domain-containing protein n=1 Tax=Rotaria socialis TaxID=392032 RepID=A0A818KA69_9BILA|nr:unnamed protein product [Rotaria socialis]CAF3450797.1 unnamed protein product [Rotaria socialis]CAF3554951.1 unnamed protein product [Rotaria socialis]CAF4386221.1 unnamed protein product [Rotaria socialis]CAF4504188.1 unnamed protein product [Rotaria socialis]